MSQFSTLVLYYVILLSQGCLWVLLFSGAFFSGSFLLTPGL